MITLYSKDGLTQKAEIRKFNYQGTFMSECFLNTTISSHQPINFEIGDYCMFRGEKFVLNYKAAKEKKARKGTHGEAFVYDNIKFNSLADELTRCEFLDIVLPDNNIHYTSQSNFSFYASSVKDLADRIQANLNRMYKGAEAWTVKVSPDVITPDKNISVNKMMVWDALALANKDFGANFIIRGRTITIGSTGMAVGRVFGYGKGNGLYDIQQNTNQDALIITRLRAYGSTRNIPNRYYNKLKDNSGKPYIQESAYIPNLMLPSFPYSEKDPSKVYIDSPNIAEYGIREGSVYFDDSNENSEIYPSIEGMTAEQLVAVGITVSLPVGDNGIINEVLGAENPTDDGKIPDEGEGKIDAQFVFYLKDLGFDLSEKDEKGQYKYATSDTMQISMKSGMCVGRTFDIVEYGITKDTSLGYTRFKVECNRFKDDSVSMAYPNSDWKIEAGDKFVILGISMPEVYVKAAAQRLLTAAQEYLSQNDETKYTYIPKIDEIFMANHPELGESLKEGDILNFTDTDLDIDASVIIQNLKINYDLDKSLIPTYEVTLSNDRIAGTIEKMQNAISSLVSNQTGITLDQVKSLINSIGSSLFLSKNFNDTAKGLIKFVKGLDIGDFASGTLGSGGTFRMDDGDSYLEVDKLKVRKYAQFTEILIERLSHIGGELVLSPARMICSEVKELTNTYRCYFDKGENNEFVQEFVVGDQARCQVFTGSTQKYYWRLVTEVGDDYIDLSKTDMDSGSDIPVAGDHIVQLGNRTNKERQNAQVLSSFGIDAPSYKQYQGIDSYSLEGKQKTVISPKGNEFDGKVTIKEGSLGWQNLQGLPEQFQELEVGAVNLLRNTGFTGDYKSKELRPDTKLRPDTPMFSDNLKFWNGEASIKKDNDSRSGYSATLTDTSLSQTSTPLIKDENYIVSFMAKGTSLQFSIAGFTHTQPLTSEYKRYVVKFTTMGGSDFVVSGRGTVCEIMLERGTIPSDWSVSPLDNDKTLAQFETIRYISAAIKNGSTSIIGGLILSSMIQLGNYINGKMKEVKAGMSGIYNDDSDVAFWAGGDLQRAIHTSMNPFSKDPMKYINFLVTHGGLLIANKAIIRGNITAESGTIGGFTIKDDRLESQKKRADGKPNILLNGTTGEAEITGRFESNSEGNRIVIDPEAQALVMYSPSNKVIFKLSFSTGTTGLEPYIVPRMRINKYRENDLTSYVELTGADISLYSVESGRFAILDAETKRIWIDADQLPQSRDEALLNNAYMNGEAFNIRRL